MHLTGGFHRFPGLGPEFVVGHKAFGEISAASADPSGSFVGGGMASLELGYGENPSGMSLITTPVSAPPDSNVAVHVAGPGGVNADLTVMIGVIGGGALELRGLVEGQATAQGLGYTATTDLSSTGRVSLIVPAGFSFSPDDGTTLPWVTAIPEPKAVLLFLAGLALVVGFTRAARKRGGSN
jgi:hypothetical protein